MASKGEDVSENLANQATSISKRHEQAKLKPVMSLSFDQYDSSEL